MKPRPLVDAVAERNIEQVRYLLESKRVHKEQKQDALLLATVKGDVDIVSLLLEHGILPEYHVLRAAIYHGNIDIIRILLKTKYIPDGYDLIDAVEQGQTEIIALLLEDGRADPTLKNNTAIRVAAYKGHEDIVALLFDDPRVRDAGLPMPNIKSKNKLARMLGEIVRDMERAHHVLVLNFKKHRNLAEFNLLRDIVKYNPSAKFFARK